MAHSPLTEAAETFKALAHPARLRLLGMLGSGRLCVCQVTAALELAASTVSEHLSELKRAGLVTERRDGRWVSYCLAEDPRTRGLLRRVFNVISADVQVAADAWLVRRLRHVPVEELCRVELDVTRLGIRRLGAGPAGRSESWKRA